MQLGLDPTMPIDPLVQRRDAAQATLDKFKDKPFKWGTRDCARLVAFHLRRLGYAVRLPPSGSYGSLLAAKRVLKARGFDTAAAALDDMGLERIAPASAIVGDVIQCPSTDALDALGVALGNGRMVAYHADAAGAAVLQPNEYVTAWRVHPR